MHDASQTQQQDCNKIWASCLQQISAQVSAQAFNTWFVPIVPYRYHNRTLTLRVPSQFFCDWLEGHYVDLLRQVLDRVLGTGSCLEYAIGAEKPDQRSQVASEHSPSPDQPETHARYTWLMRRMPKLNPYYTFDNLVEGPFNQLVCAAARAVAQRPGKTSFNPLMIHGDMGLGKTHIGQAIAHAKASHPDDGCTVYVSSEVFTNQFIEALRNNALQDFMDFYTQVNLLILDDVQFLIGKEKTQEIFFSIFNQLHQADKQIVMTSHCPPRELQGLQRCLLSRFKWGLTADLQKPDLETRMAIIQKKLKRDDVAIADELVQYIAHSVDTNIRELEGVLTSLVACMAFNRKVDLSLVKQLLKDIVCEIDAQTGIDYLQQVVAKQYKVSPDDLKGKSRKRELVMARHTAIYLARVYTKYSLKYIGSYFGGRDHSTVVHALDNVNSLMDTDRYFRNQIEDLKKTIKLRQGQMD